MGAASSYPENGDGNLSGGGGQRQQIPDLETLNDEIESIKRKLYSIKVASILSKEEQNKELDDLDLKLYQQRMELYKLGGRCKSYTAFTEYVAIVRKQQRRSRQQQQQQQQQEIQQHQEIQQQNGQSTTEQQQQGTNSTTTSSSISHRPTTTTTVLIQKQQFQLSFSVSIYLEAYLLKRLHLAMLQERQKQSHSEAWSDVISALYEETIKVKKLGKKEIQKLITRKQNLLILKNQLQEGYSDYIRIQSKLIGQLLIHEELITKDNVSEEEEVNEEDDKDKKEEEDSVTTATFDAEESSTTKDTFAADVDEEKKPEEDEEERELQQREAEVDLLQRIKQEEARIKRKIAERRDVIVTTKLENSKKKADEWYRYINDEAPPQLSQPALSSPPSTATRQATSSYVTNLQ